MIDYPTPTSIRSRQEDRFSSPGLELDNYKEYLYVWCQGEEDVTSFTVSWEDAKGLAQWILDNAS